MKLPFFLAAVFVAVSLFAPRAEAGSCWVDVYEYNGSDLDATICESGALTIKYRSPRSGLKPMGVRRGTLWFEGTVDNDAPRGTARVFTPNCGTVPFSVRGSMKNEKIRLSGRIPELDSNCRQVSTRSFTFVLTYVGEGDDVATSNPVPNNPVNVNPTCPSGFVLSGNNCVRATAAAPTPACPAGYVYSGGRCTRDNSVNSGQTPQQGGGPWVIIVNKNLGIGSATELHGATLCVVGRSQGKAAVDRYMRNNGMTYSPLVVNASGAAVGSYENGQCDGFAIDSRSASAMLRTLTPRNRHMALSEQMW